MQTTKLIRILLLPFGLIAKLFEQSIIGARDIHNKFRFRHAIVDRECCLDQKAILGEHCHVLENTVVLKSSIDRFSYVGRNSIVQNARIGSFCSIANDVFIGLGAHPVQQFSTSPIFYRVSNTFRLSLINKDSDFVEYKSIEIGHDVWIGARAIVLDGIRIGNGAVIAANAVVTKDVPSYAIVAGVPAKVVRYRFTPEKIRQLEQTQWWLWSLSDIRDRMNELNRIGVTDGDNKYDE